VAATLTCVKKGTTDSTANKHIQSSCEEPPVGKSSCHVKHRTSHVQQKNRDPKLTASHRGCGCSWKGSLRWARRHSTSRRGHCHYSLKYVHKGASECVLAFTFCLNPWQHKSMAKAENPGNRLMSMWLVTSELGDLRVTCFV
jgi:hypothetical protein